MSKSRVEKAGTGRVQKTENQTNRMTDEAFAIRISAIHKGLYDACGMLEAAPAEVKGAPDLPAWAQNICLQLRLTILKRLVDLKPRAQEVNWRNIGRMVGILQRQFTYLENWKKDGCLVLESVAVPSQHEQLNSLRETVKTSLDNALVQSAVIQNEFLTGMHEGYEIFLDTQGQFTGDRGRNRLYFVLLANWIEIEGMRHAQPPATCIQLYKHLAPRLGDSACSQFAWFKVFCKEIGLKMKNQGRPRKSGQEKR